MVVHVWPHGGCPLLVLVSQEHTTLVPLLPGTSLRNISQSCAYVLLPGDQHPARQLCRVWRRCLLSLAPRGSLPFLCCLRYIFPSVCSLGLQRGGRTNAC